MQKIILTSPKLNIFEFRNKINWNHQVVAVYNKGAKSYVSEFLNHKICKNRVAETKIICKRHVLNFDDIWNFNNTDSEIYKFRPQWGI